MFVAKFFLDTNMGSSASKHFQAMDLVKNNKIATVIATLALCGAIISCLLGLYNYYIFNLQKQQHVNIASVPGQTDCTGNVRVTGDLKVHSWQEANSETEASITTLGGIGAVGKVKAGRGVYANTFDSLDSSTVLKFGKENHVGMEIGKKDFPIEFQANRFLVDCPETQLRNILPMENDVNDLGSSVKQWKDLHLSQNVVNNNGFVTRAGSGGVYVTLNSGPNLHGLRNTTDSLFHVPAIDSKERERLFFLESLENGDILRLNLSGSIKTSNPISHIKGGKKINFTLTLNGLHFYVPCEIEQGPANYITASFKLKYTLYKRNDILFLHSVFKFANQIKQQQKMEIDPKLIPIHDDDCFSRHVYWDVCVDRSRPGFGVDGFIQLDFCEMHKVF